MNGNTAVPDWEAMWAPYDEATYEFVLGQIAPQDVVLDIGAGDLRLARALAERARAVTAIERNPELVAGPAETLPPNCALWIGDARFLDFPEGLTTAVLLMRHCAHFDLYVRKLRAVGCPRLITNARWGFGPEVVDLAAPRMPFDELIIGWFACDCGHTGFVPGPVAQLVAARAEFVAEVQDCPACLSQPERAADWPVTAVRNKT